MKYFAIVLTILVLSSGFANADDGKPMTASGNRAILFSFSGLSTMGANGLFGVGSPYSITLPEGANVNPSSFYNSVVPGIGMRWYLANNMALRGGIGFGTFSQTKKSSTTGNSDETQSGLLFGIQALAEWHMTPIGGVSPYFGGGINVALSSATIKPSEPSGTTAEFDASGTQFGIAGVAGFEWFFTNAMSLGGEYQLGLGLTSGSETIKASGVPDQTVNLPSRTVVATNSITIILSMYVN